MLEPLKTSASEVAAPRRTAPTAGEPARACARSRSIRTSAAAIEAICTASMPGLVEARRVREQHAEGADDARPR